MPLFLPPPTTVVRIIIEGKLLFFAIIYLFLYAFKHSHTFYKTKQKTILYDDCMCLHCIDAIYKIMLSHLFKIDDR